MQIVSENINIENISEFSTEYIENEFKKRGLDVVRWAIISVAPDYFTVCVSCVKNEI